MSNILNSNISLGLLAQSVNQEERLTALRQGFISSHFINDPYWLIRAEMSLNKKYTNYFIKDNDLRVRLFMAKHGVALNYLCNDNNKQVRMAVKKYLTKTSLIDNQVSLFSE